MSPKVRTVVFMRGCWGCVEESRCETACGVDYSIGVGRTHSQQVEVRPDVPRALYVERRKGGVAHGHAIEIESSSSYRAPAGVGD